MPYKKFITGVYAIITPNGSVYVGSSNHIYRRWSEHRRNLRRGAHHSTRLQAAWNKHGGELKYVVLFECELTELEAMEQKFILDMDAGLNTTQYVNNVWCNPETRAKLTAIHSSEAWKKSRSDIAKRTVAARRIAVDCSNGKTYDSLTAAANAFGVQPSGIRHLVVSQRIGKLGVRFKLASDEWRDVLPHYEQAVLTRTLNGNLRHSEETKKKMSAAKIGRPPTFKGKKHSEESRLKISIAKKGLPVHPNTLRALVAANAMRAK